MGLFGPNWMSSNEKKGLAAVAAAQDKFTLLAIAFETPLESVCLAALDRMDDETKGEFVTGDEFVKIQYSKKYSIAKSYYCANQKSSALQALSRMTDLKEIAFIAKTHPEAELRNTASHRLAGEAAWAEVVADNGDEADALLSIEAVEDAGMLQKLAKKRNEKIALSAVEHIRDRRALFDLAYAHGQQSMSVSDDVRLLAQAMMGEWDAVFHRLAKKSLSPAARSAFLRQASAAGDDCPAYIKSLLEADNLLEALKRGNQTLACMVLEHFRDFYEKSRNPVLAEAMRQAADRTDLIDAVLQSPTHRKELFSTHADAVPVKLLLQYMQGDLLNLSEFWNALSVLEKREESYCDELAPLLSNADKRIYVVPYLASRRDRRAFKPLLEILRGGGNDTTTAMYALIDAFPCPETADALLALMRACNDWTPYVEKALTKMYRENRATVGDYIKAMPLDRFRRSHSDQGGSSCHDDISAITFDFTD